MSNRPCALCCPHGYHNDCPRCLSTDPRDARIAELEAQRDEAKRHSDDLGKEVERLKKWEAEVGPELKRLLIQNNTAHRALALAWYAEFYCEGTAGDERTNLGKRASEALAALEASGASTPRAAGSPGEVLREPKEWASIRIAEHAALLKVAEAAERMIRRGFSCGKCDHEIPGASCVCADPPEDAQMPSIRSALADLRQARERKERGDGQG